MLQFAVCCITRATIMLAVTCKSDCRTSKMNYTCLYTFINIVKWSRVINVRIDLLGLKDCAVLDLDVTVFILAINRL